MPNETEVAKTFPIAELDRIQVPGFVSVYANNTNASLNFYDLCLVFGQIVVKPNEAKPVIEDRVSVTIAWEHVRPIIKLLTRFVDEYESKFGKIRERKDEPEQVVQE